MKREIPRFQKLGSVRLYSELIAGICSNPRMYTPAGTFREVAAWLHGLAVGLDESAPELASQWSGFVDWLPGRLNYHEVYMWYGPMQRLYPEDAVAIRQLSLLYAEYEAQCATANTEPDAQPE